MGIKLDQHAVAIAKRHGLSPQPLTGQRIADTEG